jgi:hypothetical protein
VAPATAREVYVVHQSRRLFVNLRTFEALDPCVGQVRVNRLNEYAANTATVRTSEGLVNSSLRLTIFDYRRLQSIYKNVSLLTRLVLDGKVAVAIGRTPV